MSRIESMPPTTPTGEISAAQMRALEAAAMDAGRATGLQLMERAGEGVVAAIRRALPERCATPGRAVVLCGPGNNGGDGYVVARLLAESGWAVETFALGDPDRLPPDALANYRIWVAGAPVMPLASAPAALSRADLVVDALFGIGLARPLGEKLASVLARVPEAAHRVAIDVPSGWATDGEGILGEAAFPADQVVTFHAPKPVNLTLSEAGTRIDVVDIGL